MLELYLCNIFLGGDISWSPPSSVKPLTSVMRPLFQVLRIQISGCFPLWSDWCIVMRLLGPLTYLVDVGEGRAWKRHIDHLKIRELGPVQEIPIVPDEGIIPHGLSPGETGSPIPVEVTDGSTEEVTAPDQSRPEPQLETLIEATRPNVSTPLQLPSPPSPAPVRQYPTRLRRPPDWYHDHM